jgi:hypothetical protein
MTDIRTILNEETDLGVHVRLCAQRHEQVRAGFKELRWTLWAIIGFLMAVHHDRLPEIVALVRAAVLP